MTDRRRHEAGPPTPDHARARVRGALGLALIVAGFPLFLVLRRSVEGIGVVAMAVVAGIVVGIGVWLSRSWLGLGGPRSPGRPAGEGWRPTLGALLVAVSLGAIVVYVVFYGAGQLVTGAP